jgi:predicted amidohydrolase YtcJ
LNTPELIITNANIYTMDPLVPLAAALAVTNGRPVFRPEQRLTREECVKGYATFAAEAAWRARDTGSLSHGKYADLIILDRDIFTCNVYDIGDTEVLLTLLGGPEVHRSYNFLSQ